MIELKDYLFSVLRRYDCHVNHYGKNAYPDYTAFSFGSIIFVDNDIKNFDKPLLPYYEQMKNDFIHFAHNYVAGVGKDAKETVEICQKFNTPFVGEVKCFKHYTDSEGIDHVYENYDIAYCEEIKNIPIFIHYDLVDDDTRLREILEFNPDRQVILCHCGMNDMDDKEYAFENAIELQHQYNNLWLEVSWTAWDYIGKDHRIMSRIDSDRLLLGTDFSKFTTHEEIKKTLDCFDYWSQNINIKRNIIKLLRYAGKPQLNEY